MNLTSTSDVIRLRLSAGHTTSPLQWITYSKILTIASGALGGLVRKAGTSNGLSEVTIVDSPSSTQHVQSSSIWLLNTDTVTHLPTFEFYDGTTATTIKTASLQAGQSIAFTIESGIWTIYSASGYQISETGADYTESWMYFATTYSVAPAVVGTPTGTTVYSYTLNGTTRYRSVPDTYDPTTDAFYSSWSGSAVSGLIVARG